MKKPVKKPKPDDPEQSAKFLKEAHDIEAAGGLNPVQAEKLFGQAVASVKYRTDKKQY